MIINKFFIVIFWFLPPLGLVISRSEFTTRCFVEFCGRHKGITYSGVVSNLRIAMSEMPSRTMDFSGICREGKSVKSGNAVMSSIVLLKATLLKCTKYSWSAFLTQWAAVITWLLEMKEAPQEDPFVPITLANQGMKWKLAGIEPHSVVSKNSWGIPQNFRWSFRFCFCVLPDLTPWRRFNFSSLTFRGERQIVRFVTAIETYMTNKMAKMMKYLLDLASILVISILHDEQRMYKYL